MRDEGERRQGFKELVLLPQGRKGFKDNMRDGLGLPLEAAFLGMAFPLLYPCFPSSANDNLMPAMKWFTWLISWTIIVGAVLAYAIF